MPAVVESCPAQLPSKLTREDCRALEAAGLLERERYELIDGELIRRIGKSRLHSIVLGLLCQWLRATFGPEYVEQEVPIHLSPSLDLTNEPEPDAIVLGQPSSDFRSANPGPGDLLLVVEVAATTRDYDLGAKAALYASAGIAEYWVFDLSEMRIVVHRNPAGAKFGLIVAYSADEAVASQAAPAASIRLRDLL